MFEITDTKLPDFNTYWEFKEQHNRTDEQLRTEQVCGKSGMVYNNPYYYDEPWGESHTNHEYNLEIYRNLGNRTPLYILDIGCGGGGFIEQCVQDGHLAIGIDLGEAYQRLKTFSWKSIPNNLFVRDIGQPLSMTYCKKPIQFDFIHSWDCFEHIKTDDIEQVCQNIQNHCKNQTVIILKIGNDSNEAHRTVFDRQWWVEIFNRYHFFEKIPPTQHALRERAGHMFYLQYWKIK